MFGEDSSDYAITLDWLAELYKLQSKYDKAEKYLNKSISIKEKIHGEFHDEIATSLIFIGDLYHLKGEYQKSEEAFKVKIFI